MRKLKKPSITTWPAKVPVSVELCPAAKSATANRIGAVSSPKRDARVRARLGVEYRRPAARTWRRHHEDGGIHHERQVEGHDRIDQVVAAGLPVALFRGAIRRVCTRAECKYKLCGITVAPTMPIATYRASVLVKANGGEL